MSTKPGRAPSDYKPKAKAIAVQKRMSEETSSLPEHPILLSEEPTVDPAVERKQEIINSGIGSKKIAAKLVFLALLFLGLVIGSIVLFANHLLAPAFVALGVAVVSFVALAALIRRLYKNLVDELGRDETIDLLFSIATPRDESKEI